MKNQVSARNSFKFSLVSLAAYAARLGKSLFFAVRSIYIERMHQGILGFDIGGANLKAAHSNGVAMSLAFELWKHPARLADALVRLAELLPAFDSLAVTMTGELCDCFATKRDGVRAIMQGVQAAFPAAPVSYWALEGRFVDFDTAWMHPLQLAAANWLATAHLVGDLFPREHVLLVDAGSTTTDILFIRQGLPEPRGFTDAARMAVGELVYTGARRTPICALLNDVAAELFATTGDAYVLLGLIPERPDDTDTADGRPMTQASAHARLARMRCGDADSMSITEARQLAQQALQVQWSRVASAIAQVCADRPSVERVVIAGSGEILARAAIARSAWRETSISPLSETLGSALSAAACAYAVARLAVHL